MNEETQKIFDTLVCQGMIDVPSADNVHWIWATPDQKKVAATSKEEAAKHLAEKAKASA